MTPSQAVYAVLSGAAPVTALAGTRLYPARAPQEAARPHVVYRRLSAQRDPKMGTDSDIVATRFEVVCTGDTYDAADGLHDAVRAALQRTRGTLGSVVVHDVLIEDEQGPDFAEEPPVYESSLVVELRHTET